jgi:hypothetical protein
MQNVVYPVLPLRAPFAPLSLSFSNWGFIHLIYRGSFHPTFLEKDGVWNIFLDKRTYVWYNDKKGNKCAYF